MSNPSLLVRLFAAGDAGDLDMFDQYSHDDVIVHAPVGLSTVGLESERASWRKARLATPDLHHQFIDVFSSPTAEAAHRVVTGTMRGSHGGFSSEGRSFRVDQACSRTLEMVRSRSFGRSSILPSPENSSVKQPGKQTRLWLTTLYSGRRYVLPLKASVKREAKRLERFATHS